MKIKQLPQGWKEVELGELYDITSSKRVFQSEWKKEGIPFYRAREIVKISKNGFVNNELFISEEMYEDYSEKYGIPKEGDIMVTGVGTLGICYLVEEGDKFYFKDGNIIWLKKRGVIDSNYIKYLFQSKMMKRQINSSKGTTVGTYTIVRAKKTKIPLPPFPVQKKIVQILEKAEQLKQKRKQADKLIDDYLKSIFNEMFFGKNFEESELEEITEIVMGQSPPGDSYNENGKGMPFFQGKTEFTDKYSIVKKWTTKPSKIAEPNSILMSVRAPVGDINLCPVKSCIGRGLASIIPKENLELNYLYSFLKLNKEKIADLGSGSTFKAITSKQLKTIKIPFPPLALQKKFALIVENIEKLKEKQKQSSEEINNLFNALMQKAFLGELI